jgi:hypothetical protein
MNSEALFLFLILLLGLVLCSFLGGNCNKEGYQSNQYQNSTNTYYDVSHNDVSYNGYNISNVPNNVPNNNYTSSGSSYDNYNHYNGSSTPLISGTIYYGPNGGTVTVITGSNGNQALQYVPSNGQPPITLTSSGTTSSGTTSNGSASATTYYGPNGNSATIATVNGQQAIQVSSSNGTTTFTQQGVVSNSNTPSSTQYYGSTGTPIPPTGTPYQTAYNPPGPVGGYGATANQYYGPYGGSATSVNGPYGGSAGSVTTPAGNSIYYAQPPQSNNYSSVLSPGIPATQIPPGQEDLYILKSEVIPPVCPVCPSSTRPREEPCPACPPCGRCPEPSFECKKVPNYNAIDDAYLPVPVLNSFSSFGM